MARWLAVLFVLSLTVSAASAQRWTRDQRSRGDRCALLADHPSRFMDYVPATRRVLRAVCRLSSTPARGWARSRSRGLSIEAYYRDGQLDGWVRVRHANGQRAYEGYFRDGVAHGWHRAWHVNGQRAEESYFVDGDRSGWVRAWHRNGQRELEGYYSSRQPSGWWRTWYANGARASEVYHVDGRVSGWSRSWWPDGSLRSQLYSS